MGTRRHALVGRDPQAALRIEHHTQGLKLSGLHAGEVPRPENLPQISRGRIHPPDPARLTQHVQRTAAAVARGFTAGELAPVSIPQRKGDPIVFAHDEFAKPATTLEGLAGLRPAFRPHGSVTAGNASGLNDGSAALLIASEDALRTHALTPLARIVASGVSGVEPRIMGIGPVPATQLALKRAGLTLADIDHIELNEAFAAQALAVTRSLGLEDLDPRINPNGGAIALGHPLGMSGARLVLTAARALHETQGRYALVTMCIGVGQGYAVVLERV